VLFLILKEAIHNTVKHAQAENLNIQFDILENAIQVLIEDDGIGIGEVRNSKGKGLNTMPERARQVGGTLTINSNTNKGTQIIVNLPFEEELPKGLRSSFIKFINQFKT
jgi:signal transduction histidine kinase